MNTSALADEAGRPLHRSAGRVAAVAAALALLSGCVVGPDYTPPQAAVNGEWLEARGPSVVTGTEVDVAWWRTFDDPVLDDLVHDALDQNLSLRIAGLRVLQSMAQRGIAVGELFPQSQSIGAGYSRKKNSENPPALVEYRSKYSANFTAGWEPDFWGRFRRSIEAADAELDASLAGHDAVAVSLVAEIALTYVDIRTLQERLELARRNVELQEKSLAIATERFEAGATSELDQVQSESLVEQTRASIPAFEQGIAQATYRLGVLLGQPPGDLSERLGAKGSIPEAPERIAVGVPAELLRRRPDIRVAERQAAAASAAVGASEAELYPSFTLAGSIGYSADRTSDLFESASWTGFIAPGVSWPVLNYGRIENSVRAQDAAFQAAIVNYQNTVISAAAEVEGGLAAFTGTRLQAEHLALSAKASRRSVELSTVQYREGDIDLTRVLDSLVSLASLEDRLATTRGDVVTAVINTFKALGGGWQTLSDRGLVPDDTLREMRERTDWGELIDAAPRAGDEPAPEDAAGVEEESDDDPPE